MFTIDEVKRYIADTAHQDDEYDGIMTYEDCDCTYCTTYAMICDIEEHLETIGGYTNV